MAAPQGGGRARTAPGSSFGAGGADRPQPPANALSMVLTARSTARCSGHKLFLGARKKISVHRTLLWRTSLLGPASQLGGGQQGIKCKSFERERQQKPADETATKSRKSHIRGQHAKKTSNTEKNQRGAVLSWLASSQRRGVLQPEKMRDQKGANLLTQAELELDVSEGHYSLGDSRLIVHLSAWNYS